MVKKTGVIATVLFAVALAGTIGYSVLERSQFQQLIHQQTKPRRSRVSFRWMWNRSSRRV